MRLGAKIVVAELDEAALAVEEARNIIFDLRWQFALQLYLDDVLKFVVFIFLFGFDDVPDLERPAVVEQYLVLLWVRRKVYQIHLEAIAANGPVCEIDLKQHRFASRILVAKGKVERHATRLARTCVSLQIDHFALHLAVEI